MKAKINDSTVAVNLQRQFEQVVESFKRNAVPHNVELEDGNPFVWVVTYFGKPMTNLDGGLFRFRLHFSTRFPDEQPRAKFEGHIFHHRIAWHGTPCYFASPTRREDVKSHIEAIFEALERNIPPTTPARSSTPRPTSCTGGRATTGRSTTAGSAPRFRSPWSESHLTGVHSAQWC